MTPHVSKLVIWEFVSCSNSRTNQYDQLNRLQRAVYQKPDAINPIRNSYNESLWYDKNGNIIALQRYGEIDDVVDKIEIDQLTYIYDPVNKNRLTIVDDSKNITHGFKDDDTHPDPLVIDSTIDYTYDDYGNMKTDTNKGITDKITYNHLNLPIKITLPNGIIEYLYNAVGMKVEKKVTIGSTIITTDYQIGYQYIDSHLQFFPHAEGYVNVVNGERFNYVYNYTDHLGNIRVSYGLEPGTNALKILEENHYYPFGLKHKNYGVDMRTYRENNLGQIRLPLVSEVSYKYKYNGKEWQDELGLNWYDYGWRNFDPVIGRWVNMDPLLNDLNFTFDENQVNEENQSEVYDALITKIETGGGIFNTDNLNPYSYGYNNPVSFDDPDGRCPICPFIPLVIFLLSSEPAGGVSSDSDAKAMGDAKVAKAEWMSNAVPGAGVRNGTTGTIIRASVKNEVKSKTTQQIKKTVEKTVNETGKRTKNRLPDEGEPNSMKTNEAGTTTKKYGPDGKVQKEYNKAHQGDKTPKTERSDHVHDYKPNPNHPQGKPTRQPARKPKTNEMSKDKAKVNKSS